MQTQTIFYTMEPVDNLDVLAHIFEFCKVKDRKNMSCVSRVFKEAFDVSRKECSKLGMIRVRNLFSHPEHGATRVFEKWGVDSMVMETIYVSGGGRYSYYTWEPDENRYNVLTYILNPNGTFIYVGWKQHYITCNRNNGPIGTIGPIGPIGPIGSIGPIGTVGSL